jgi:hypothetical protein
MGQWQRAAAPATGRAVVHDCVDAGLPAGDRVIDSRLPAERGSRRRRWPRSPPGEIPSVSPPDVTVPARSTVRDQAAYQVEYPGRIHRMMKIRSE